MDDSSENSGISKVSLVLIAVLSIGGIILLGLAANLSGQASYSGDYSGDQSCCTIQYNRASPIGYTQLGAKTSTQTCSQFETERQCCGRVASDTRGIMMGARYGSCDAPQVQAPLGPVGGYGACCTTEQYQHSPKGYQQGESTRQTEYCQDFETPNQCCIRSTRVRTSSPFKLLDGRNGYCGQAPQVAYPVWIPQ